MTRTETLSGWGRYPRVECRVEEPADLSDLRRALAGGALARGLGRSYGDQALNDRGVVLDMTALDRYLAFDEETATLRCEAGVSLETLIRDFAPRGYFPMVTPGTKFVTVGGCVANDIHGKAHHADGCFSKSVRSMNVMLADGEVVTCSREERPELFWATFGGLGLTGIIVDVTMRLRRIETTYFHQRAVVASNLGEMLEAIHTHDARYPYSVAWIDPLATGEALGRGVLTVGEAAPREALPSRLAAKPLAVSPPSPLEVPVELPNFSLNPLTLRILNAVIERVLAGGEALAHYEKFFFPLDAIGEWNRGYGPRGFTQYQFVIPLEDGERRMRVILERIARSGFLPFLNVLKQFGEGEGMLSFPFRGYTYAIDFPIQRGLGDFLHELDRMVVDVGGRVYLGKDAFLEAELLPAMYPALDEWKEVKARVDPQMRFTSNLSRRVGLSPL